MDKKVEPLKDFFKNYTTIAFQPGEHVARTWEFRGWVMYLKSGIVKIYSPSKTGREILIGIYNVESNGGSLILGLSSEMKKYQIEAITPVEAIRAPKEAFYTYGHQHPDLYVEVINSLFYMTKDFYEQIDCLKTGNAFRKVSCALYYLSRECGTTVGKRRVIDLKITHQMLANLCGLTRETVVTQIQLLKSKKLIEYDKGVFSVPNMPALADNTEYQY